MQYIFVTTPPCIPTTISRKFELFQLNLNKEQHTIVIKANIQELHYSRYHHHHSYKLILILLTTSFHHYFNMKLMPQPWNNTMEKTQYRKPQQLLPRNLPKKKVCNMKKDSPENNSR